MRSWLIFVIAVACFGYQKGGTHIPLPSNVEMAKIRQADHKKNLQDVASLIEIAAAMKTRIEKESPWVVSVKTVKDTGEIQRLAKRIHGRLKSE